MIERSICYFKTRGERRASKGDKISIVMLNSRGPSGSPWCGHSLEELLLLFLENYFFPAYGTSFTGLLEIMNEKTRTRCVSSGYVALPPQIAERIGETDGIKTLARNGKALKKEKCLSWVVSVSRDLMSQYRNEVRTDLVNRTERLKPMGEEMMIACNFNIFLLCAFRRRFSCWGCTSGWHTQVRGGHSVSNCDVPGSAARIAPWNESEPIGRLLSVLSRPCGSFMDGKPAFDNARHFIVIIIIFIIIDNKRIKQIICILALAPRFLTRLSIGFPKLIKRKHQTK